MPSSDTVDLVLDYLCSVLEQVDFELDVAFAIYDTQVDLLYLSEGSGEEDIKACRVLQIEDGYSPLSMADICFDCKANSDKIHAMVQFVKKLADKKRSKTEANNLLKAQATSLGNCLDKVLQVVAEIASPSGAKVFVFNYNLVRSGDLAVPQMIDLMAIQEKTGVKKTSEQQSDFVSYVC